MYEFDFVGVGIGPANLSLAALAAPVPSLRPRFYDPKPGFSWHPGLMLPEAHLQVSVLKDLVSLVDPTNPFTFLNFLVSEGRAYRSLVANGLSCSRQEFEQYYRWVAEQLPTLRWNRRVDEVTVNGDRFEVVCVDGERSVTDTLVLASGREPSLPDFAEPHRGRDLLHGSDLLTVRPALAGRRLLVVGAGQSGAEVVNYALSGEGGMPSAVTWISGRVGFQPIDDSPFTNEWFAPDYVEHFYNLSPERREFLLGHQRLASDGVSESLLRKIYQRLYQLDTVNGGAVAHRLAPCRRATDLRRENGHYVVGIHDLDRDAREECAADVVVFCTGYRSALPSYLDPIRDRIVDTSGELRVQPDYSLDWDGPSGLRIFVQNLAERSHGIADPNLSLASWRSAKILNAIVGRDEYRTDHTQSATAWSSTASEQSQLEQLLTSV
ncbi:lysine N6-hydroxylase [Streptacidiphilus sp. BW17]|uniref:lysine N(6)-hydroxylase/L-ornithine N(5)-oxygenase family protein n=1 Tax=Streptacidiphilus sp. BW17 TaxID=3156274 RepID=UPI003517B122